MSTIVAVRKNNKAAIAADHLSSQGDTIVPGEMRTEPPKIHQAGNGYIGVVGSMAHHRVLRSLLNRQPGLLDFTNGDAVFETLRKIHPILQEEYHMLSTEDDGDDQPYESTQMSGLVVSSGGVFSFHSHREVSEYNCFWAAGSGSDFALGSMESLYSRMDDAKSIAESAVAAACKFDAWSGLPIVSFELELDLRL